MNALLLSMRGIFPEPVILLGLIALIGLVPRKKSFPKCIPGTVKTIVGFIILGAGAGLESSALGGFSLFLRVVFGIHNRGVVPNNEAIVAIAQNNLGREIALVMFFAIVINRLIARWFTR